MWDEAWGGTRKGTDDGYGGENGDIMGSVAVCVMIPMLIRENTKVSLT